MGAFAGTGLFGPHVDEYRRRVREVVEIGIVPLAEQAERDGLFPRKALAVLGSAGLIRERWGSGDVGQGVILNEELGRTTYLGIATGIGLNVETVIGLLTRFGQLPEHQALLDGVLDGSMLGCLGLTERRGGSDLNNVHSTVVREAGGWRVRAEKKFLSLGRTADFAILLCRLGEQVGPTAVPQLAMVVVPTSELVVVKPLRTQGMHSLDTTWMKVDTWVGDAAMLGRPGLGLATATWALSCERLAVAAQLVGAGERAIALTTAHLHRRTQFGRPLIEHQALRLRIADLAARLSVLRYAVYSVATEAAAVGSLDVRRTAAVKVTAARFAERLMSECLQMFGGAGFLEDETPLARLWREARLSRIADGTDEILWELIAAGLTPDFDAYENAIDTDEVLQAAGQ